MSLIFDVRERSCLVSLNPLVLGRTSRYEVGRRAILLRVLYRWCTLLGTRRHDPSIGLLTPLLDIGGTTFSPVDLKGLRQQLERQARAEDFVGDASVPVTISETGLLYVKGSILLIDDTGSVNLPLEVTAAKARPVLLSLGG